MSKTKSENARSISLRLLLVGALFSCVSPSAFACSEASCLDDGPELNRNFAISVKHAGKPLPGVHVRITGAASVEAVTSSDGKATFAALLPGNYWLTADFLGTGVAYQCFHIAQHSDRRGKGILKYQWGDDATNTRQIAGSILDVQHGRGGTPLWNSSHYVEVPVATAALSLQNVRTGEILKTTSGVDGSFTFGPVPKGTYVLHVHGGTTAQPIEPTDFAIAVNPNSRNAHLTLTRSDGWGCGGSRVLLEAVP